MQHSDCYREDGYSIIYWLRANLSQSKDLGAQEVMLFEVPRPKLECLQEMLLQLVISKCGLSLICRPFVELIINSSCEH